MFTGYCFYTASNPDWGYDARKILHKCGGARGYLKMPKESGNGYYIPFFAYLFKSVDMYNDFCNKLKEITLDWHIDVQNYNELPSGTIILDTD